MKFRIEKGVNVYCRNTQGEWNIEGWSNMLTEKAVEFDVEDIWFAPKHSPLEKTYHNAVGEPKDFRKRSINTAYYMVHHYGFHLPKNKYNVEQIVIQRELVTVIEDPKEKSHISEKRRLQRKVRQSRRNYSFTGNIRT